jgi:maltose O-acetyltransferase
MFGAGVRVGPRVCIYTKGHPRGGPDARRGAADITVPVVIGDGVWLRGSVTVQPGVIIARGCIIAVGAVVTRSTAPDGFYAGNPARRTHDIDASGNMTPCNQEK